MRITDHQNTQKSVQAKNWERWKLRLVLNKTKEQVGTETTVMKTQTETSETWNR